VIIRLEHWLRRLADAFNWVAAASVLAMMLLTCADIVLRLFRRPIPGTYEMVGLLGAVFASFSLAYTSYHRGHIAVDFLVQKLPPRGQTVVEAVNALVGAAFFVLVARQCLIYGSTLKQFGEISMTLQMPLHPFVYGIAAGCGLLAAVLLLGGLRAALELAARPPQ
jgi:TRAP-type C4-dicarboxylate transport system permease small subunit